MNVESCCHTGFCLLLNAVLMAGRASCYSIRPAPSTTNLWEVDRKSHSIQSSFSLIPFFPLSHNFLRSKCSFSQPHCICIHFALGEELLKKKKKKKETWKDNLTTTSNFHIPDGSLSHPLTLTLSVSISMWEDIFRHKKSAAIFFLH